MTRLQAATLLLVGLSVVSAAGQLQFPRPEGAVSDFAGSLNATTKQQLEALLTGFRERSGGIEIAVVTIRFDDLKGYPVEDYSLRMAREWGIGGGADKAGLLLLLAIKPPDERGIYRGATRLEVSRHLEGDIPDGLAGEIISRIRDDLRAGRFDQAVTTAVHTIVATLAQKRGIAVEGIESRDAYSPQPSRRQRGERLPVFEIIIGIIVLFAIISAFGRGGRGGSGRSSRRRRYGSDWALWPIVFGGGGPGGFGGLGGSSRWGDSSGGGGFEGFGGGGDFGGGGASDSW